MRAQPQVLVVDDDVGIRHLLQSLLSARGYHAVTVASADDAIERYRVDRPAAVILDVALPGRMDGLDALAALKKIDRDVPVIMLSGERQTPTVVQAIKLGASDFVGKPFDTAQLEASIEHAVRQRQLSCEVSSLREHLQSRDPNAMLIGHSKGMAQVREMIERVADTSVPVLIRGEAGTGKSLVARSLSASSLRRNKPFVTVNCAAMPTDFLEGELFGFERGVSTGTLHPKPGRVEFANHGTLFLDEVGDISAAVQAKLLRLLQGGGFSRLGGTVDVSVDVRTVAATTYDLEQAVADGQLREDLFSRLNVATIHLPPLRERREEIPLLADHFLKKYSVQCNKPHAGLSEEIMRLLVDRDWPGNIRELETTIERIVVLGDDAAIRRDLSRGIAMPADRVPAAAAVAPPQSVMSLQEEHPAATHAPLPHLAEDQISYSLKDIARTAARKAERELILKMLQRTKWNRKETADILGISYKALLYKIKEAGLDHHG